MRRPRPAPSAARTAISCCRATPRASSRLATLTQAMSSSRPTAANRISSDVVGMSGHLFAQGHERQAASLCAYAGWSCAARAANGIHLGLRLTQAGFAVSRVRWRPARARSRDCQLDQPVPSSCARKASGSQTSVRPANGKNAGHSAPRGKSKSGGRMPMIVRASPLIAMRLPTSAGSPPKRRSQSP